MIFPQALDDTVSIDTAEGVRLFAVLADPVSRVWAFVLDIAIIALLFITLVIFLALTFGNGTGLGLFLILLFILLWGYFFLFEWLSSGKTPGKRALKLRVVSIDLMPLSPAQAAWRNVLRYLDFLPGCFGIGMAALFISPKNQRVGDWMAGTIVIFDPPPRLPRYRVAEGNASSPPWRLSREEQRLILDFAHYANSHHISRAIELSTPLAPLLPEYNDDERVAYMQAWARWIGQA